MHFQESTSQLIARIQAGDEQAARIVWDQFFPQLVSAAQRDLPRGAGCLDDEEDVALSALQSFYKAVQRGRFSNLHDDAGLSRLLFRMTRRKVVDRLRRHLSEKQGGGNLRGDSALMPRNGNASQLAAGEPAWTAELQVMLAEQIHAFRSALREKDPRLEAVALAKLDGCSNQELAHRFERSIPTIERWLQRIRVTAERVFHE